MRVLVVEDDPRIVDSIRLFFRLSWPDVEVKSTRLGRSGIDLVGSEDFDLMMLDLGLPDISGFEVLQEVRAFSSVPVIIVTVAGDEQSIAKALEWGADDYIVKPWRQLELLARVRARLRDRSRSSDEAPMSLGALHFDPVSREFTSARGKATLTGVEARIMHRLMIDAGHTVTYSKLAEEVWGDDYPGSANSLQVYIRRLRQKLEEDPGNPLLIQTRPRVRYFLERRRKMNAPS